MTSVFNLDGSSRRQELKNLKIIQNILQKKFYTERRINETEQPGELERHSERFGSRTSRCITR